MRLSNPHIQISIRFLYFHPFMNIVIITGMRRSMRVTTFLRDSSNTVPLISTHKVRFFIHHVNSSFRVSS